MYPPWRGRGTITYDNEGDDDDDVAEDGDNALSVNDEYGSRSFIEEIREVRGDNEGRGRAHERSGCVEWMERARSIIDGNPPETRRSGIGSRACDRSVMRGTDKGEAICIRKLAQGDCHAYGPGVLNSEEYPRPWAWTDWVRVLVHIDIVGSSGVMAIAVTLCALFLDFDIAQDLGFRSHSVKADCLEEALFISFETLAHLRRYTFLGSHQNVFGVPLLMGCGSDGGFGVVVSKALNRSTEGWLEFGGMSVGDGGFPFLLLGMSRGPRGESFWRSEEKSCLDCDEDGLFLGVVDEMEDSIGYMLRAVDYPTIVRGVIGGGSQRVSDFGRKSSWRGEISGRVSIPYQSLAIFALVSSILGEDASSGLFFAGLDAGDCSCDRCEMKDRVIHVTLLFKMRSFRFPLLIALLLHMAWLSLLTALLLHLTWLPDDCLGEAEYAGWSIIGFIFKEDAVGVKAAVLREQMPELYLHAAPGSSSNLFVHSTDANHIGTKTGVVRRRWP
ncbi:hypothetical protein Dimus_027834 [Dionaea muscipula]